MAFRPNETYYNWYTMCVELDDFCTKAVDLNNEIVEQKSAFIDQNNKIAEGEREELDQNGSDFHKKVGSIMAERQEKLNAIHNQKQMIASIEQALQNAYARHRVSFNSVQKPTNAYNESEALQTIQRIRDDSGAAMIKRTLGLDGWASKHQMAGALYLQLDAAMKDCQKRLDKIEKQALAEGGANAKKFEDENKRINAKALKKLDTERAKLNTEVAAIKKKAKSLANSKQAEDLNTYYDLYKSMRGSPDGWDSYTPVKEQNKAVLIGRMLHPAPMSTKVVYNWTGDTAGGGHSSEKFLGDIFDSLSFYSADNNSFVLPMTRTLWNPPLMYAECSGNVSGAADLFRDVLLRQLRFMPMKSMRIIEIDPVGLGSNLGSLIHLTKAQGGCGVCDYIMKQSDITDKLSDLTQHVAKVTQALVAVDDPEVVDIYDYNYGRDSGRIPYTSLVIHDFPVGFNTQSLHDLEVLITNAQKCGLSIMISRSKNTKLEGNALRLVDEVLDDEFLYFDVSDGGDISFSDGRNMLASGKKIPFKRLPVQAGMDFYAKYNEKYSYKPPIKNDFLSILGVGSGERGDLHIAIHNARMPELRSTAKRVRFPLAVDPRGKLIELEFHRDDHGYGFVTGAAGSGKTTMLHTIITSAAIHHSPKELEIWLVDYKIAEFAFYKDHQLPHVRHIVMDNESDSITYSVLKNIMAELNRRADLFVQAGVPNYDLYRKSGYELPSLLIIVDEFARMSQAAAADTTYKKLLENIFATARSHGVHILICDQYANGLNGLSDKARAQIQLRFAMKNEPDQIKTTLGVFTGISDSLAKQIKDVEVATQGTMIYRHDEKDPADPNGYKKMREYDYCRCLYASEEERALWIERIQEQFADFDRPLDVYAGPERHPLDKEAIWNYEQAEPVQEGEGDRFYIGSPAGIGKCFHMNLRAEESGENILLVGSDADMRQSLLKNIIRNARRHKYERIIILAFKGSMFYAKNKGMLQKLHDLGCEVYTTFAEICYLIGTKANEIREMISNIDSEPFLADSNRTLIIIPAVDDLYTVMDQSKLAQKQAWAALTPPAEEKPPVTVTDPGKNPVVPTTENGGTSGKQPAKDPALDTLITDADALVKSMEEQWATYLASQQGQNNGQQTESALSGDIDDLDNLLGEDDDEDNMITSVESSQVMAPAGITYVFDSLDLPAGVEGYNAIQDLALLISDGYRLGIHSMITLDTVNGLKKMHYIKIAGNFNHRIAMRMSADAALNFLSSGKLMNDIAKEKLPTSAVYEYLGTAQRFNPYL